MICTCGHADHLHFTSEGATRCGGDYKGCPCTSPTEDPVATSIQLMADMDAADRGESWSGQMRGGW